MGIRYQSSRQTPCFSLRDVGGYQVYILKKHLTNL